MKGPSWGEGIYWFCNERGFDSKEITFEFIVDLVDSILEIETFEYVNINKEYDELLDEKASFESSNIIFWIIVWMKKEFREEIVNISEL